MSATTKLWLCPQGLSVREAADLLRSRMSVSSSGFESTRLTYYDTFDWRLYSAGGALAVSATAGGVRAVWSDAGGRVLHQLWAESLPTAVDEFAPGPFLDAIGKVIKMRRLLPRIDVATRAERLSVVDENGSASVRILVEERVAHSVDGEGERPLRAALRLSAEPGHDGDLTEIAEAVGAIVGSGPFDGSELDEALGAFDRRAADYSSKIKVVLDSQTSAGAATRTILSSLLDTMLANERGTRLDLDSEFLHDFRVAGRRTRSALGQIRGVFRRKAIALFREEFSWLGSLTGPTRDLDVFLLKLPEYERSLPKHARAALAPLAELLRTSQKSEQSEVRKGLESPRYRSLVDNWRAFLDAPGTDIEGKRARRPVLEVSSRCIRRAHKRVLRRASGIGPESPAAEIHRLRIDCKKLRYLLEFFRSLYPPKRLERLVSALKRLQDNLGDFNDYGVHQEMLESLADQLAAEGLAPPATLEAIRRMKKVLRRGELNERKRLTKRVAEFAGPSTTAVFGELFPKPEKTGGTD